MAGLASPLEECHVVVAKRLRRRCVFAPAAQSRLGGVRMDPLRAGAAIRCDQPEGDAVLMPELAAVVIKALELHVDILRPSELRKNANKMVHVADELLPLIIGERKPRLRAQLVTHRLGRAAGRDNPLKAGQVRWRERWV